jgi:putative spermidine/putrescine transport system substrate-binding protein
MRLRRNAPLLTWLALATWLALSCACSRSGESPSPPAGGARTAIGPGEGAVSIVTWAGYVERGATDKSYDWVTGFEKQTGCQVSVKTAATSDEMVALMNEGGFDLVTASGDASLRLVSGGRVQEIAIGLVPSYSAVDKRLQDAPWHTVNGKHYGVPYQWGSNVLLYNTKVFKEAPTSWEVVFREMKLPDGKSNKGRVQAFDGPIHIADAANYLMAHKPDLGIKDPYELNEKQLAAAVELLKKQRPLIKKYWALASDEVELFKNGDAVIGAAWPYQTITLKAAGAKVEDLIPAEGATGWADSWMLSAKSKHPNCAYKFMEYVSTPKVQAAQALFFGETPANLKACVAMDAAEAGSCAKYHLSEAGTYIKKIKFWKTPQATCSDGSKTCTGYNVWQQKWQEIKG